MATRKRRARGAPKRGPEDAATELIEAQAEQLAELEIVFELYCELWDQAAAMPPYEGYQFVLEELAESGASPELQTVLAELRRLPFVASEKGAMNDRDRIWFGLQIQLNELLQQGKRLLLPELVPDLAGYWQAPPTQRINEQPQPNMEQFVEARAVQPSPAQKPPEQRPSTQPQPSAEQAVRRALVQPSPDSQ
jgi:hypothetical protein